MWMEFQLFHEWQGKIGYELDNVQKRMNHVLFNFSDEV